MREQRKLAPADRRAAQEVQERPDQAQRRDDEALPGARGQPAGRADRMPPARRPDADPDRPLLRVPGFATARHPPHHFLWVPNLNDNPNHHLLIPGLPIPVPVYLVFPLLAALDHVGAVANAADAPGRQPDRAGAADAADAGTMIWLSPLMIGYFALNVPAGLGLYWFIGNCVSIVQQSFVVGWGTCCRRGSGRVGGGSGVLPVKGRRPAEEGAVGQPKTDERARTRGQRETGRSETGRAIRSRPTAATAKKRQNDGKERSRR